MAVEFGFNGYPIVNEWTFKELLCKISISYSQPKMLFSKHKIVTENHSIAIEQILNDYFL